MTTPNIDLAREWTRLAVAHETSEVSRAAAEVIQSLPDEWIDAEKLREVVSKYEGNAYISEIVQDFADLLTPPLPTLAELIEQGNDPQQYQWMQCDDDPGYVIMQVGETVSRILLSDGNHMVRGNRTITPLPDLQKLEWPSLSVSGESEAVSVETEESEGLPRPEDVPAGEPWLVKHDYHKWVGARESRVESVCSWTLARLDGADYTVARDMEATLVSRLVPEHKENA